MSERFRRVLTASGLVLFGAASALLWQAALQPPREERPPIVIDTTPGHIGPRAPSTNGDWGRWGPADTGAGWIYEHGLPGPRYLRTSVVNGQCYGDSVLPAWRQGAIRITLTDGSRRAAFVLAAGAGVLELTGDAVTVLDPDPLAPFRLTYPDTFKLERLESADAPGPDFCLFTADSRPSLLVEQQR